MISTSYVILLSSVVSEGGIADYQGWRHERVRGQKYDDFVDRFVGLVKKHQSKCLLHFEDFVSFYYIAAYGH
jgi:hypothetical protein